MFSLNTRLILALYLLAVFLVLYSKPEFIFNKEGNLKKFGVNSEDTDATIFPLWLIFTVIAFGSYYIIMCFNV